MSDFEQLAQWLDREAVGFAVGASGVVSRLDMVRLLLKFATALRDIETERAA